MASRQAAPLPTVQRCNRSADEASQRSSASDTGPRRRGSEVVQLRWWHAERALVGRGLLGCGSGPDGRRVDAGRQLAAAIRPGRRYGQCAGRAGRGRPVGDDADIRGGRRLLRPDRARAAAGRDRRAADPDHRGRRGHASGGEPGARGRCLPVAAHYLGIDRARGCDCLACRGLAAGQWRSVGPTARGSRSDRRGAARLGHVVRR